MFDYDLQVRFWRGLTDAMMHSTDASLATASAWQSAYLQSSDAAKPAPVPVAPALTAASSPVSFWWLGPWQSMMSAAGSVASNVASPMCAPTPRMITSTPTAMAMNPWLGAWMQMFVRMPTAPVPQMQPADFWKYWGASPAKVFAGPFASFWPWSAMRWDHVQSPITAMFMSVGMPFAIAAPSAKASTAALDAAHAAREQMDKLYAVYRSDSGHAVAQIAALPWAIAVSFIDANAAAIAANDEPKARGRLN